MNSQGKHEIEMARQAAINVLLHNSRGIVRGLPRTAGWGYPEPYTRDLMIATLGIAVSGNKKLIESQRRVLQTLARNQSKLGHIPSLVNNREDRGASDTTPLFILAATIFRKLIHDQDFLEEAVRKAVKWMEYQSPFDRVLVAQQPTTDWRDEQWVMGFGLYVNTIIYSYLRLMGQNRRAKKLYESMAHLTISSRIKPQNVPEGLKIRHKPYFSCWSFKLYSSERFDLLGNSIAILSGLASFSRAKNIVHWIDVYCNVMKKNGDLAINLVPNFFPFIRPGDEDWRDRYAIYNKPGDYHNGGIWPFISAFYIAALVATCKYKQAEQQLLELTETIRKGADKSLEYGFNEWYKAQNGKPMGQDWQTWSAAMYLYAARCVETRTTPYFDEIRQGNH
jgi:Alkaline and neutral invertase